MPPDTISADEYAQWVSARRAYNDSFKSFGTERFVSACLRRLQLGSLKAAAKKTVWHSGDGRKREVEYEILSPTLWLQFDPQERHDFWGTSDADVYASGNQLQGIAISASQTRLVASLIGVRFDPVELGDLLEISYVSASLATPTGGDAWTRHIEAYSEWEDGQSGGREPRPIIANGDATAPIPARSSPLTKSDAERFAKAILAGWPDVTEVVSHQKALLFFPENTVPRDWFYGIFRAIRGPKKRGKQPIVRN